MKNGYFIKQKILLLCRIFLYLIFALPISVVKFVFAKRTLMFMTNGKIKSFTLGFFPQLTILAFVVWVSVIFYHSLRYDKIIGEKTYELSKIKEENRYFQGQLDSINQKLSKVNEYITTITGNEKKKVSDQDRSLSEKKSMLHLINLSDSNTITGLLEAENKLLNIDSNAKSRTKVIESALEITGLNFKKGYLSDLRLKIESRNKKLVQAQRQIANPPAIGGPDEDDTQIDQFLRSNAISVREDDKKEIISFASDFDYLLALEKVAISLPFAKPMHNYYISSGFGTRKDPVNGRIATHYGLDFVGIGSEKIISPSKGKVVLARTFSDYGNAVLIDHGFGITTRYGHLASIAVKEGQQVTRGQILGIMGSTGKSTGPHLHYEVRHKNVALNPRNFLEAGARLGKAKINPDNIES